MNPRTSTDSPHMRRRARLVLFAVGTAALCVVAVRPALAEQQPYGAVVSTPQAKVYSGPGVDFYACDTLPAQTAVEVYRHDKDGWCAIRPPEGSASWVFGRHVDRLENGLGTINKDGVVSRVGSKLVERRDVVHVRLNKGETVRVLDREQAGGQEWLKIAPPAGEFRWVRLSDIHAVEPIGSAGSEAAQERAIQTAFNQQTEQGGEAVSTDAATPTETEVAPTLDEGSGAQSATSSMVSMSPEFAELVAALETNLSQTVAAPHGQWELGSLEQEAESLLMRARTIAERDAVKSSLARIDRFVSIQRRYDQVARGIPGTAFGNGTSTQAATPAAPPAGGPLISSRITAAPAMPGQPTVMPGPPPTFVPASPSTFSPSTVAAPGSAPLHNAPFDASGVLKPVVSRRADAPRYALVDESGHVVSFITPTPDVNLQPYVGYRVGVVGRRDYLPNYQRNHVTASRITPLTGQSGRLWR